MRMYDIIKKKRDGSRLSEEEISFFIKGYTGGEIPDEQVSALLMAICFQGMDEIETAILTKEIAHSGEVTDLSAISGFKVDKHSSGGVGDKTTLIVAPIVASLGVKVAKMSGRGLGHTGGTTDKLESIPGFCTELTREEFISNVERIGIAVAAQTKVLAPADKKLYALRDVTATVDCLPLIASSIMGKKLASGADGIVLDVKVGNGSFNKKTEDGIALARTMVKIGSHAGKKTVAVISDMSRPLGRQIGNALEIREAVSFLRGDHREPDLYEICLELSSNMLSLAGKGDIAECRRLVKEVLADGRAYNTFKEMVRAQGGDVRTIDDLSLLPSAPAADLIAPQGGYVVSMNTEEYGRAALILGAGRSRKDDVIDPAAGITVLKKVGEYVQSGEPIARLYTNTPSKLEEAKGILLSALVLGDTAPAVPPIVHQIIKD